MAEWDGDGDGDGDSDPEVEGDGLAEAESEAGQRTWRIKAWDGDGWIASTI